MRIELGDGAVLDTYVAKTSPELTMPPRPAVLVLPGGGYSYCSAREAEPVANLYRAAGCNAFVLYYRCGKDIASCPIKFKAPLIDAARAVDHIRSHAEEYGINPHQVAVTGFSAGGHLAGWLSANPGDPDLEGLDCRPDAMLLGYPVVSGVTSPNLGTFRTLLGSDNPPRNELENFSVEHMITPDTLLYGTPPMTAVFRYKTHCCSPRRFPQTAFRSSCISSPTALTDFRSPRERLLREALKCFTTIRMSPVGRRWR